MHKRAIVFDVAGVILRFSCNGDIAVNSDVVEFLKKYSGEYDFFTNTSLSHTKLERVFQEFDLEKYFLAYRTREDGGKDANVKYILEVYGYTPEQVLFIDDTWENIEIVRYTKVHLLHYTSDGISLEEKVKNIFKNQ